jgi:hypothetical protein
MKDLESNKQLEIKKANQPVEENKITDKSDL